MKQFQAYLIFLRLFRESYLFAIQAIVVNKVRTILSLLGITIGIFCVISVFTVFDSMEAANESGKICANWILRLLGQSKHTFVPILNQRELPIFSLLRLEDRLKFLAGR